MCDHVNGSCPAGCSRGWHGRYCNQTCDDGYFGEMCTQECGVHCLMTNRCNKSSGVCIGGCMAGWTGEFCDSPCPAGTYGFQCSYNCSENCLNISTCNNVNGSCNGACATGWGGDLCNLELNGTRVSVPASLLLGVGIGGGLVFLLADIVIVILIARHTSRSRLKVGGQGRRLSVLSVNYYADVHSSNPQANRQEDTQNELEETMSLPRVPYQNQNLKSYQENRGYVTKDDRYISSWE